MNKQELIELMNQLCELSYDAKKLANDFAELATQVAVLIGQQQVEQK